MNVVVVEDDRIVLEAETLMVQKLLPNVQVCSFQNSNEALAYAKNNKVDIAFLDIIIGSRTTGLQLAKKLQGYNPKINIIFCTECKEFALDALNLYCSAYLMKPITYKKVKEALENLRHPISQKIEGLRVKCFGNFEVYKDGVPIKFQHKKTKELLAYLIDRCGATVSTKEIEFALYKSVDAKKESYIRNLRADLKKTFKDLGVGDAVVSCGLDIGLNMSKIECDYYEYLDGHKELFRDEYMTQYIFAEVTREVLKNDNQ